MEDTELKLLCLAYERMPETTLVEVQAKAEKRVELINMLSKKRFDPPKAH